MPGTVIFESAPGRLTAMNSQGAQSIRLNIAEFRSAGVLTGITVEHRVAAQFQPSLDNALYIIPFGDGVGRMTLELILNPMDPNCSGGREVGPDKFVEFYLKARLSPVNFAPAVLTLHNQQIKGFVTGMRMNLASTTSLTFQGAIDFVVLPPSRVTI